MKQMIHMQKWMFLRVNRSPEIIIRYQVSRFSCSAYGEMSHALAIEHQPMTRFGSSWGSISTSPSWVLPRVIDWPFPRKMSSIFMFLSEKIFRLSAIRCLFLHDGHLTSIRKLHKNIRVLTVSRSCLWCKPVSSSRGKTDDHTWVVNYGTVLIYMVIVVRIARKGYLHFRRHTGWNRSGPCLIPSLL